MERKPSRAIVSRKDQDFFKTGFPKYTTGEEEKGVDLWLITFTDVMALMLTFFVLLYSMSAPEEKKWSELTFAINKELGRYKSPELNAGQQDSISVNKIDLDPALNLDYLASLMRTSLGQIEGGGQVRMAVQPDRLVLVLPGSLFFENNDASGTLKEEGQRFLFQMAETLMRIRNGIEVTGVEYGVNGSAPSLWGNAALKASQIAGVLYDFGYTKPFGVRGQIMPVPSPAGAAGAGGNSDNAESTGPPSFIYLSILKSGAQM